MFEMQTGKGFHEIYELNRTLRSRRECYNY
jgi:hypothetical protein